MEMQPVSIVYVDDNIDQSLSRYLDEYCNESAELIYAEEPFFKEDTYEALLKRESIRTSNILLIDSKLFEEADAGVHRFSGEEFRVILNKLFPYIEVIVISQNTLDIKWDVVEKCKTNRGYDDAKCFYDKKLKQTLDEKRTTIRETRQIVERLVEGSAVDKALMEKIQKAVNGAVEYDELKASDIDRIVQAFQELVAKG